MKRPRLPTTRLPAAVFAVLAALVTWFSGKHHEFWRDETQAFLIARDTHGLRELLHALRYEGHPPLLHLLFELSGAILSPPWSIAVIGGLGYWLSLVGTHRLLALLSRRPTASFVITIALGITFSYAYELGIVVRGYGLGLGLALLGLTALLTARESGGSRDRARAHLYLGLAALTSAHAACLAGGAVAAHAIGAIVRKKPKRALWALAYVPFAAIVIATLVPHEGRSGFDHPEPSFPIEDVPRLVLDLLTKGLCGGTWWSFRRPQAISELTVIVVCVAIGWMLLAASRASHKDLRIPLLALALHGITLGYGLLYRFHGHYRHWLFFALPFLLVSIAWSIRRAPRGGRWIVLPRALIGLALVPWLARDAWSLDRAVDADERGAFSATKGAALALPEGAIVLSDDDFRAISISYWRPDVKIFARQAGGRQLTYLLWDKARREPKAEAEPLAKSLCARAPDRVFAFGGFRRGPLVPCATRVTNVLDERRHGARGVHPANDEMVDLMRVDCDCVASGGRTTRDRRGRDR